jgi:hypothetical protein
MPTKYLNFFKPLGLLQISKVAVCVPVIIATYSATHITTDADAD